MQVLLKYTEYNEPHESLTNKNIIDVSHAFIIMLIMMRMLIKKANIDCEGKTMKFIRQKSLQLRIKKQGKLNTMRIKIRNDDEVSAGGWPLRT